jgi:uncharacterized protein (DUF1697 family)
VARYVAFLRAINVAGHGTLKMADLRAAFERAGAHDVRTVIQSGNVVFDASRRDAPRIIRRVRASLGGASAEGPEMMVRDSDEVRALVAREPFAGYAKSGRIKFYVAFFAREPARLPAPLPIVSAKEALDAIAVEGREAFIVSRLKPSGFFGFPNNFIEDALGVTATTRNWSTVTAIGRLMES